MGVRPDPDVVADGRFFNGGGENAAALPDLRRDDVCIGPDLAALTNLGEAGDHGEGVHDRPWPYLHTLVDERTGAVQNGDSTVHEAAIGAPKTRLRRLLEVAEIVDSHDLVTVGNGNGFHRAG